MQTKLLKGIFASIGILVLILDAKTAMVGAAEGLQLCLTTVIPSLLPFFVLSIMLTSILSGADLRILRPIGRLCKMPSGSEHLLLLGLMGGYPAGAQAVSQAYQAGQLTRRDASRLLGFCNNAGPSFLFGIAAAAFDNRWMPWALWLIHVISAVITGMLLPGSPEHAPFRQKNTPLSFSQAAEQAVKVIAKVCAWIVLFRVLLAFCNRWFLWLFDKQWQVLLAGVLELANGCLQLKDISSPDLRFLFCSCILSLGGVCVAVQTASVTGDLGFGQYFPGKLLQCGISAVLSCLLLTIVYRKLTAPWALLFAIILSIIAIFLQKWKNNSGNLAKVIV